MRARVHTHTHTNTHIGTLSMLICDQLFNKTSLRRYNYIELFKKENCCLMKENKFTIWSGKKPSASIVKIENINFP